MEKVDGPLKRNEFLVLAALEAGPLHGYGLVQAIEERTGAAVRIRPGDLYRVLHRLVDRGYLEEAGRRKTGRSPRTSKSASANDERRTYYRATRQGRRALQQEAALLSGVIAAIQGAS